jgi:uncharacterized protein (TIGR02145 family)
MKKYIPILLFLILLLVVTISLFAQEPIVKFYLNDGSSKQFNISEIENISVLTGNGNYIMNIYEKGSKISNFPTKEIESIKFETDAGNNQVLNIYISGKANSFKLLEIDSINFKISEEPLPQITSINPASGKIGDEITINGKNFGDSQGSGFVSFNGTDATVYTSWSSTIIKVKVPTGATSGKLFVSVNGKKSNEVDFVISDPSKLQVISITPKSAKIGDEVVIKGSKFGASQISSKVSFNGTNPTEYLSWSDTEIKTKIPKGAKPGKVSVTVNNEKSNELDFSIIPWISAIIPVYAGISENVTITGTGFGDSLGTSKVSFNKADASNFLIWNDSTIKAEIPQKAETGKVSMTVGANKSNEVDFTVIQHLISISPESGIVGAQVTITGTNFGDEQGTGIVSFNNINASEYISWTATEIKVTVPNNAKTGKVTVSIEGKKSNELNFAVIPQITSVEPALAKTGDIITITGTSFGDSTGTCIVTFFNRLNATKFISWKDTEIKVKVPAAAETGKITITSGGIKSNESDFSVIPNIENITPKSGIVGAQISITGTGFGSKQNESIVTFNGADASIYVYWSTTGIDLKVPQGAKTGKVSLTVGGNKSNEMDFTVTVNPHISSIDPASAKIGDEITISGTDFGDARGTSVVSFKSKDASEYTSWSDTEIKVKVPAGAKTGKVYVTVEGQKSNEYDFTVSTGSGNNEEVTIGTQVWTLKNLDVTTYRNGDAIPEVTDPTEWANLTTGAWCYYDNDQANGGIYGKLYNWYAIIDSRGLAPEGWHIPTIDEWLTLANYLGGENVAGCKIKETNTTHWRSPNTGATNESGFTALGGGHRGGSNCNVFFSILEEGSWWSSSVYSGTQAWFVVLTYQREDIRRIEDWKCSGKSVRCVKD